MLKKIALWLLMAAVIGALVGGVALKEMNITMDGKAFQVGDLFKAGVMTDIHDEETVSIQSLSELEVSGVSESLEVVYEDREDVFIVLDGRVSKVENRPMPKMVVETLGDKITVKMEHPDIFGFNRVEDNVLTVYVPMTFKPTLDLSSVSGDVTAAVYADSKVKSVSGRLKIEAFNQSDLDAESTSGNITVEGDAGEMNLKTVSGNIDCRIDGVKGDLQASSVSGGIECLLKEVLEGFKFTGDSTSGDVAVKVGSVNAKAEDFENLETTVGNGKYRVNFHSVSGNILLND